MTRFPRIARAFTLVELLVVIGIIALLISILLPALSKAKAQANALKCATQLREIGNAFRYYANDNRGYYPPGQIQMQLPGTFYNLDGVDFPGTGVAGVYWFNFLNRYVTKSVTGGMNQSKTDAASVKSHSVIWGCTNWEGYKPNAGADAGYDYNRAQVGYGMNTAPFFQPSSTATTGQYAYAFKGTDSAGKPTGWQANVSPSVGFLKAGGWGKIGASRMLVSDCKFWSAESAAPSSVVRVGIKQYETAQEGDGADANLTTGETGVGLWRHGKLPPNDGALGTKASAGAGVNGDFEFLTTKGKISFNLLYCDGHVITSNDWTEAYRSIRMKFPG